MATEYNPSKLVLPNPRPDKWSAGCRHYRNLSGFITGTALLDPFYQPGELAILERERSLLVLVNSYSWWFCWTTADHLDKAGYSSSGYGFRLNAGEGPVPLYSPNPEMWRLSCFPGSIGASVSFTLLDHKTFVSDEDHYGKST